MNPVNEASKRNGGLPKKVQGLAQGRTKGNETTSDKM